jgi:hypothetical protein
LYANGAYPYSVSLDCRSLSRGSTLRGDDIKGWYDKLPFGRTSEKLLMVVRAILAHARSRGWIDLNPAEAVERQRVRYSGDYDFYSREEIDALVRHAGERAGRGDLSDRRDDGSAAR